VGLEGDEGWYISSKGQQIGPLAIADMLSRAKAGDFAAADLVWHPSMQNWMPASDVFSGAIPPSPSPSSPIQPSGSKAGQNSSEWLRAPEIRLKNSTYLMALFGGITAFLVMTASSLSSDDASVSLILLAVLAMLGWWCFLEFRGLTLRGVDLIFPARLPFWPYLPAYGMRTVALDRISSAETFSRGKFSYGLVLGMSVGQVSLIFDDLFLRDLTLAAILARNTQISGTPTIAR
jgi:hypothetical protein